MPSQAQPTFHDTPNQPDAPTPIFGAVFSDSVTETVIHPAHRP